MLGHNDVSRLGAETVANAKRPIFPTTPVSIDAGMMADDLGRMQRLDSMKVQRSMDLFETNPHRET